jgi:tetratricopeptide (TPR) repeat protein
MNSWRRPLSLAGWVAVATFAVYLATVCPTVPFGDGGELIAAAASLGVAHPPGYPLYTSLGWLALQVLPGEPALRMNLLSALFGALTCGALTWLLFKVTGSRIAAVASALALAVSSTMWKVSTVTEVYTLHLFLIVLLSCAAFVTGTAPERRGRRIGLLVGAAALGLGLAHHPTIVLALPAAAVLAAAPRDGSSKSRPRRAAAWLPSVGTGWIALAAAITVAIPMLLYWTLMIRARLDPPHNWGEVTTLAALRDHVSAVAYRHLDLGWAGLARGASWRNLGGLLLTEFTPWVWVLALPGLAGLPRLARARGDGRARWAAGLLIVASALFGLRYVTGDVEVFYLPAFLGAALAAGLGVARLRGQPRKALRLTGLAAAVLLVALPAAWNASARNLRGMTAAEDYARDVLATVPEDGVLFVQSDDAFLILYLVQVLGERPDVTIYDRKGALFRSVFEDVSPLPGGVAGYPYPVVVELAFIQRELSQPEPRDLLFVGWPGYPELSEGFRLEPAGLLFRFRRAGEPAWDDGPTWAGYHEEAILDQARRTGDPFALAIAATYSMARGERALYDGDRERAYRHFDEAVRIAGRTSGVHKHLGTIYARVGDYGRAIASFRHAIEIKPGSIQAWNNLAMAYRLSGDTEAARDAYHRSLALVPEQADVRAHLEMLEAGPR